jgi:uncharacterized protein YcfJ
MGMKAFRLTAAAVTISLLASACATQPMGPRTAVMPGANKPFEVFQQDDAVCRQFASQQVGGEAQQANNQAVGSAILGTVLGAGLGAAVGGGRGAGIGAASGAVAGTAIGAGQSDRSQYGIQRQYDVAYQQCMYSKGNQVAGYQSGPPPSYAPPPSYGPPPAYGGAPPAFGPPPAYGPPPPPGY